MIPIGDDNPTRRFPAINYALLIANIALFVYELSLNGRALDAFLNTWSIRPVIITAVFGGDLRYLPLALIQSTVAMFLHGGWLHIIGNMLFLWIFGDNVEDNFGWLRYLGFYLGCGYAAVIAETLLAPESATPMIGASGAVSGVLAAYLLLYPRAAVRALLPIPILFLFPFFVPAWLMIIVWFATQLLNGIASFTDSASITGGIAYGAHVGGFIAGIVFALWIRQRTRPPLYRDYPHNQRYFH